MSIGQDIRFAVRSIRQNPVPTLIAVLTLALGMGANTAIFSAIDAVLLNSAPLRRLREPNRLVMIWEKNPSMMEFLRERMPVAAANLREWKRQNHSFEDIEAYFPSNCNIGSDRRSREITPERVDAIQMEPGFLTMLGIQPALGRFFTPEEARTSADRVVLLSASLYRRRFGNDADLTGKSIRVNGTLRSIVGVLPAGFQLPANWEGSDQKNADVWSPLDINSGKTPEETWARNYLVYARLRPGVGITQARTEMEVIGGRLLQQFPDANKGFGVNVFSLAAEDVNPDLRRALLVLQVAVGFVLLIACANVANLLLARAIGRGREIAIRLALGAGRGRIVRLMLTESMLISAMAAAAGLLLGFWSLDLISALAPSDAHGLHELHLDPAVLLFAVLVAFATGIVFGLAPAIHSMRSNINEGLTKGGRAIGSGPRRLRSAMVISEVTLALVLLIGAGLMIRSLRVLSGVDLGFNAGHLLTTQISLADSTDENRVKGFCSQLLDRVGQLPGVKSASISSGLPMESVSEINYEIEGKPAPAAGWNIGGINNITETFFRTMEIPILRGRDFTRAEAEAKQTSVMEVSDSFARANWPGEDPLGKVVQVKGQRFTVIGVVGDTHQLGPDQSMRPSMYVPSRTFADINLAVRTAGDPGALGPALERVVWSIDPQQPVQRMRPMEGELHNWVTPRRFNMTILGLFAGLALLLASVGLYGVVSYAVTLRTRELGVRMALGASRPALLRLIVAQGFRLALAGVALGLVCACLLTRLMSSLLFGVSPGDLVTFVTVPSILVAVALLASYIPARRAANVDPILALRVE